LRQFRVNHVTQTWALRLTGKRLVLLTRSVYDCSPGRSIECLFRAFERGDDCPSLPCACQEANCTLDLGTHAPRGKLAFIKIPSALSASHSVKSSLTGFASVDGYLLYVCQNQHGLHSDNLGEEGCGSVLVQDCFNASSMPSLSLMTGTPPPPALMTTVPAL